jgi:hypothetical protein
MAMRRDLLLRSLSGTAFVIAILAAAFTRPAAAEEGSSAKQPTGDAQEIWQSMSITATIEAINTETRVATLRIGENVTTLTVDERVKRLGEFKVGDKVKAKYYISLATEIREPTAEEKEMPLTVLEGAARAPLSLPPGAGAVRQIRAVVTVEDIDRPAEMVKIKGPRGKTTTVRVLDPSRLDKVSVGDTVVVTYTEALAISLEAAE